MSDTDNTVSSPKLRKGQAASQAPEAAPAAPQKVATIQTRVKNVRARGFTFGAKQTVPGVPLSHAVFLKDGGEAHILEVTEKP